MYMDPLKACVMLVLGGWIQSSQAVSDCLGRSLDGGGIHVLTVLSDFCNTL